eukprot:TRINITY_DN58780_c0_g1_i1.p4 TRINITY_DN58780_c0_g1~~TRINITY_DN58780_c0_g1_i1.p4  ORF type:complete len:137 (-),score=49.72 TRINITY_DN58780_c0_g1_i1:71-481(-)
MCIRDRYMGVENLKRKMNGGEFVRMMPWYKNYKGTIMPYEQQKEAGFLCYGIAEVKNDNVVKITELPIKKWTRDYKNFLESRVEGVVREAKEEEKKNSQKLSLIHISEPTRPLYISYAVFCLKKKKPRTTKHRKGD